MGETGLLDKSHDKLAHEVYIRLLPTDSASTVAADVDFVPPDGGGGYRAELDAPATILRHPAMWEAFMGLPEHTMLAVLNGESSAEERLAERYVKRFFKKAGVRSSDLEQGTVELAFIKIAVATKSSAPKARHPRSLWYSTIGNALGLGIPIAEKLLSEAMSSGLVIGDYDAWVWRFAFVQRYLAAKEKSQ